MTVGDKENARLLHIDLSFTIVQQVDYCSMQPRSFYRLPENYIILFRSNA